VSRGAEVAETCESVSGEGHQCECAPGHTGLHHATILKHGQQIRRTWSTLEERKMEGVQVTQAYAFLQQRDGDRQPWPTIYTDQALADNCKFRVSPVVLVRLVKKS